MYCSNVKYFKGNRIVHQWPFIIDSSEQFLKFYCPKNQGRLELRQLSIASTYVKEKEDCKDGEIKIINISKEISEDGVMKRIVSLDVYTDDKNPRDLIMAHLLADYVVIGKCA